MLRLISIGLLFCVVGGAVTFLRDGTDAKRLRPTIRQLRPLHRKLGRPQPGDWLATHKEAGQTFSQYLRSLPVTPNGRRRVIYLQPLGRFTPTQDKIVKLTAEFLGLYFSRPVKTLSAQSGDRIPQRARRVHPQWGDKQILTTYVLYDLLKPKLPADAAACIALTSSDLWPGKNWNFVFGQASLRDRVGVWSIYRNGDPDAGAPQYHRCLRRTLKTATHEMGHMFSLQHCIAFECNMCGSNNRQESDRAPLYLCPECHAKVCWATGAKPADRFQKLADFCEKHGLREDAKYYLQAVQRVE